MRISFDMDGVLADMDAALAKLAEQEFGRSASGAGRTESVPVEDHVTPESTASTPATDDPAAGAATGPTSGTGTPAVPPGELPSAVLGQLSTRQRTRLWQRARETRNFWESLEECEQGTVRRLQRLAHDLRWDVLFVTQRPDTAGRTAQLQTQHWLRRHGFEYPAVYTTQASRGRIAAALTLDVHIDDRLENAIDIANESKSWPILVWRDEASFARISTGATKMGIATVRTVAEAISRIEEVDRAGGKDEGPPTLLGRLKRAFRT